MRSLTSLTLTLLLAFAALSPTLSAQAPRLVNLTAGDNLAFSLPTITAKPGELLRVVLRTRSLQPADQMAHNFVLLKPGVSTSSFILLASMARQHHYVPPKFKDEIIVATPLAAAGESVTADFRAPRAAGPYPYVCTYPGHYNGGMKGTLVVK
jgi:azurin